MLKNGREERKGREKRNDNKKTISRRGPRYQLKSSLRSAILLSEVSLRLDSDSSKFHLVLSRASPPLHVILSTSLLFFLRSVHPRLGGGRYDLRAVVRAREGRHLPASCQCI